MSIVTKNVVMYGIKLNYTKKLEEKVQQYTLNVTKKVGQMAAFVGMDDKHIWFGHLIAISDEHGAFRQPVQLSDMTCDYMFTAADDIMFEPLVSSV